MFPCSDWATTPILENIPDSLGDIERVKTQQIIVWNGIMNNLIVVYLLLPPQRIVVHLGLPKNRGPGT